MNALLWNICNNDVEAPLIEIIREKNCDIVFLIESKSFNIQNVCNSLSLNNIDLSILPKIGSCERVNVILSNKYRNEPFEDDPYFSISRIYNAVEDYIIATLHLPTMYIRESDKAAILRRMVAAIEKIESTVKHSFIIVVGDFNLNPFDDALLSADTVCAIPTLEDAQRLGRSVNFQEYRHFYNPMWKLYGRSEPPYGTFFYPPNTLSSIYWHIFDQVIVSPSLISRFQQTKLEIISRTCNHSLLKNQKPNKEKYSDHLPLFFSIESE